MTGRNSARKVFNDLRTALKESLGEDAGELAYRLMIEQLGGQRVRIPSMREYSNLLRNERIRRVFRDTSDVGSIAVRFGVTRNTIYRIIRKK